MLPFASAQTVPFKHVVIIVQENRSTDNLFGSNPNFEPGVDIATFGMNSQDEKIPLTPIPLVNCYDLNHRHIAFVTQYNNGRMNGSDKNTTNPFEGCKVPPNPQYKYVDNSHGEIQPYFDMAKQYGWANRMFQTNQGPSFTAHVFLISGTSAPTTDSPLFAEGNPKLTELAGCIAPPEQTVDVLDAKGNDTTPIYPCFEHPTLTDVLNGAHISWKYYAASAGFIWTGPNAIKHMCVPKMQGGKLVCTGADWVNNVVIGQRRVLDDIRNCELASVVWITPSGLQSDHPKVNDGSGPAWVSSIVNAIGDNPACGSGEVYWKDTAILITWDDWGGWYDHVPPFRIGQPKGWGKADTYGFRVPLLVVSAYTPAGFVDNSILDFGSILKYVEVNFGAPGKPLGPIPPGTYADAYAENNLRNFFPLTSPRPFQTIKVKFNSRLFLKDTSRWLFDQISNCGAGCWF